MQHMRDGFRTNGGEKCLLGAISQHPASGTFFYVALRVFNVIWQSPICQVQLLEHVCNSLFWIGMHTRILKKLRERFGVLLYPKLCVLVFLYL